MNPIITVENLVKRYKQAETNAVDDISFEVEAGQLFALLGPNGAGKTTTISILTTIRSATAGTARIAGFNVMQKAAAVRQRIGIIFQQPSLDLNLTAEENVRFHAIMYGMYAYRPAYGLMPRAYKRQLRELSELLGIGEEIFNPVKTYSGGMKRKLEIIRSLIHQPQVLFLDEPTVGLDAASRRNLWKYIQQVQRERGTTVFLTTHYLEEAEGADTVCIINKGHIVSLGTPEAIKSRLTQSYLLLDARDRPQLEAELTQRGIVFSKNGGYSIDLTEGLDAHELLKSIETPLNVIKTRAPSLEDAYLAIVDEA